MGYFLYELAANPAWQERIREELKETGVEAKDFDYTTIKQLPLLHAFLYEVLRLRPGVPMGLPRVTPKGGCMIDNALVPEDVCFRFLY